MSRRVTSPTRSRTPSARFQLDLKTVSQWDVDVTCQWLDSVDYADCTMYFREHRINGRALLMLNEDDLKEVIKHNVGQRKNLYHLIRMLQARYNRLAKNMSSNSFFTKSSDEEEDEEDDGSDTAEDNNESDSAKASVPKAPQRTSSTNESKKGDNLKETSEENNRAHLIDPDLLKNSEPDLKNRSRTVFSKKFSSRNLADTHSNVFDDEGMSDVCESCLKKLDKSPYSNSSVPLRTYKGEKRKTLVSVFYLFATCLWTSFILTVVHDRVPDMTKYPPLPDIILDNVPLMPWAFFATEIIGMVLVIIFLVILVFHRYRLIIFRRLCSLGGTIYFLRSITMLITSLSVPGIHIQCSSQRYGSLMNKLHGAWNILCGVGLYVQGVRTCGDYMFSGHTVWLTLLTHFITEYTPQSMTHLHTGVWILNVFGLFFILGAHEHYSIDVFVAFYISSRLFLYYHSLANNKALFQRDHKRVKVWFPMLSYFESNVLSMVPNEYQWPPNIFVYFFKMVKNRVKQVKKFVTNKPKNK